MARAWYWSSRWLPQGWLDALRQLVLFAGAYYAYRIVRGAVDGQVTVAFAHAREIVDVERSVGLFFEPGLQDWALNNQWIVDAANWCYINSHFLITTTFLIWLYLARNESYYYVRNMFMVAMGLALVLYVAYPTAPPRFLPEWGFADTVTDAVGQANANNANLLYNPYAAVPSMHVAFALMIAIPAIQDRAVAGRQGAVVGLPAARHLRRARHRQPLVAGRGARRDGRRGERGRRLGGVRPRPARGLGLAHAGARAKATA